jgi:hypothetical protein
MRSRVLPLVVLVLAASMLALPVFAGPDEARRAGATRQAVAPESHAPVDAPTLDNFGQVVANHFGNPAAGQVVIQGWIRQTYDSEGLPSGITGYGQATRLHRATRVQLRTVLRTRGGSIDDNATHAPTNSGSIGNPRIFSVHGPSIAAGLFDGVTQFCTAWVEVLYSVRWDDGTLSSGRSFVVPSDLWNDNCYFITPPAAQP